MAKTYGDPKQACPIKDSSISVLLTDSKRTAVGGIQLKLTDVQSAAHAGATDGGDGKAIFNPFKKGKYDLKIVLSDEQKHVYFDPEGSSGSVGDKEEVAVVSLKLRPNTAVPKIQAENAKAWLHKEKDSVSCTAVQVELYLEEDRPKLPYTGEGKLKRGSPKIALYTDEKCTKEVAFSGEVASIPAADLKATPRKKYWAKGTAEAGKFELELELPDPNDPHVKVGAAAKATVEVALAKAVKPCLDAEFRVVLLDRKLDSHLEATEAKSPAEPIFVDVYLKEETPQGYTGDAYTGGGKLKRSTGDVEAFTDEACTKALAFDGSNAAALTHEQLVQGDQQGGKKLRLYLKGKKAGKFDLTLELEAADKKSVKVLDPLKLEMGVVELQLEVHRYNVEIENPPPLEAMTDEQKIKEGRVLHVQDGAKHGRAKVTVKKVDPNQWPAGCDKYELLLQAAPAKKDAAGKVKLFEAETGGSGKDSLKWAKTALDSAEKVVWVEGSEVTEEARALRLHLGLDRPADAHEPQEKKQKTHADWAALTVVKFDKIAPDGQFADAAADYTNGTYRQYVNVKAITAAWAGDKGYVVGDSRTNDSGKVYEVITKGKSAASGGPTGTEADITDGTAHWKYVGMNRGRKIKLIARLTKKIAKVKVRFRLIPGANNWSTLPAEWRPIAPKLSYRDSDSLEVSVKPEGTAGNTRYDYWVVEKNGSGKVLGKGTGFTFLGNATLNSTNYNRVEGNRAAGAAKYDVYLQSAAGNGTKGKIASDLTALEFEHKGEPGDGAEVPAAPPKHILAETNADGVAEAQLDLSLCGGDVFEGGAYLDQDPVLGAQNPIKSKSITIWRRFWYQMTSAKGFAPPAPATSVSAWRRVNVEMVASGETKFKKVSETGTETSAPAGTFYPGWMLKPGRGDTEEAVIGSHNKATFYALFKTEADKPLKCHLVVCEHQWDHTKWDAIQSANVPVVTALKIVDISTSPSADIAMSDAIFQPPLAGGALAVTAQYLEPADGTWKSLPDANISLPRTRATRQIVRVTLPATATQPTATNKIKVKLKLHGADGPYLGESSNGNIMCVYDAADEPDYNDTITHEIGHSFNQTPLKPDKQPEGTPEHPEQFLGQGNHCKHDNKKCVMYESGPQTGAIHRFCDICEPYVKLQGMEKFV